MQSAVRAIYPPQCVSCGELTDSEFGLCGPCWRDTGFIGGLTCDLCGAELLGEEDGDEVVHCDYCLATERPWSHGRAVFSFSENGRRIVTALKYHDKVELARPAGTWMAAQAAPLISEETVIVPVPLHWRRLFKRRFNQSAELAKWTGKVLALPVLPDGLVRVKATPSLYELSADERLATMEDVIRPHPKKGAQLRGKPVLLVDDVMTTGATLAACARALTAAGAVDVCVLVLARAAKDA